MRDHREAEHLRVEALGVCEVGDLEPEMIQTFKFHWRCSMRAHIVDEWSRTRGATARAGQARSASSKPVRYSPSAWPSRPGWSRPGPSRASIWSLRPDLVCAIRTARTKSSPRKWIEQLKVI